MWQRTNGEEKKKKKKNSTAAVSVSRGVFCVLEVKERTDKNSSCLASNDKTIPADPEANPHPLWRQKAKSNIPEPLFNHA